MIRTIFFDLGQVLIQFDFQRGYRAISGECNLPPETIRAKLRETGLVGPFEEGRVAPRDFFQAVSEALGLRVSYERFCELWSTIFFPETLIPESLIASLHKRYRLLLLSNTNIIHFEMIQATYPIMKHFDGSVLSYEVGAMKPAPEIYQEAIRRSGCAASGIFFTDDIAANVEGAREQGIDAVQFQSVAQLEEEMRSRRIDW
ncbi:MAG: HAD family phosphatase [Bryobacteraceae bacterium]